MIKVSAAGKIHLSGEHSVVYGQPALLAAIDKRLTVSLQPRSDKEIKFKDDYGLVGFGIKKIYELLAKKPRQGFDLRIKSQIPIGSGLGSSAALAVALTGAVLRFENRVLNKDRLTKISYEIEKKQHGNASGGDIIISCYGGFLKFQKAKEKFKFARLRLRKAVLPQFLLVDSGRPKESTGEMVVAVRRNCQIVKLLNCQIVLSKMGKTTEKVVDCFRRFQFDKLGSLIKRNERLLEELGVVGEKAKRIISLIEKMGGAAKICGAGGIKKGSGMILAYHENRDQLIDFLIKKKLAYLKVKLGERGVWLN